MLHRQLTVTSQFVSSSRNGDHSPWGTTDSIRRYRGFSLTEALGLILTHNMRKLDHFFTALAYAIQSHTHACTHTHTQTHCIRASSPKIPFQLNRERCTPIFVVIIAEIWRCCTIAATKKIKKIKNALARSTLPHMAIYLQCRGRVSEYKPLWV